MSTTNILYADNDELYVGSVFNITKDYINIDTVSSSDAVKIPLNPTIYVSATGTTYYFDGTTISIGDGASGAFPGLLYLRFPTTSWLSGGSSPPPSTPPSTPPSPPPSTGITIDSYNYTVTNIDATIFNVKLLWETTGAIGVYIEIYENNNLYDSYTGLSPDNPTIGITIPSLSAYNTYEAKLTAYDSNNESVSSSVYF